MCNPTNNIGSSYIFQIPDRNCIPYPPPYILHILLLCAANVINLSRRGWMLLHFPWKRDVARWASNKCWEQPNSGTKDKVHFWHWVKLITPFSALQESELANHMFCARLISFLQDKLLSYFAPATCKLIAALPQDSVKEKTCFVKLICDADSQQRVPNLSCPWRCRCSHTHSCDKKKQFGQLFQNKQKYLWWNK